MERRLWLHDWLSAGVLWLSHKENKIPTLNTTPSSLVFYCIGTIGTFHSFPKAHGGSRCCVRGSDCICRFQFFVPFWWPDPLDLKEMRSIRYVCMRRPTASLYCCISYDPNNLAQRPISMIHAQNTPKTRYLSLRNTVGANFTWGPHFFDLQNLCSNKGTLKYSAHKLFTCIN